jgi:hypothetical protein
MASIVNRSAFTVTVPGYRGKDKNKYTRKFAYGKLKDAEAYMRALIEQGLTPDITQGETTFQVKVVRVGHEPQCETFHSLREAEAYVKRIEAEAEVGLFRDYTQAAKTTTADLIRRYMEEDCPGMGGGDNYITILRAMLEDSTHELRKRIEQRKAEIKEFGKALTPLGANRHLRQTIMRLQEGFLLGPDFRVQLVGMFHYPRHGDWAVKLDAQVMRLFEDVQAVWMDRQLRARLPAGLATWLLGYIRSQPILNETSLKLLQSRCGSPAKAKNFADTLREALRVLEEHGVVVRGWAVSGGKVKWSKGKKG